METKSEKESQEYNFYCAWVYYKEYENYLKRIKQSTTFLAIGAFLLVLSFLIEDKDTTGYLQVGSLLTAGWGVFLRVIVGKSRKVIMPQLQDYPLLTIEDARRITKHEYGG